MDNSNFVETIKSKLTGGNVWGPSRFSTFMLEHIDDWEKITYQEIKEIVELIKYNGSTYTFFPFCYLFLEIDLFRYYEKMSYVSWNKEKAKKQIKSFKVYPLSKEEKVNKLRHYQLILPRLRAIKKRLIKEGAYEVTPDGRSTKP